jgi:mRNA-degrading endonuclease RelE of RelBE toxin-antitoxin system
MSYRIDTIQSFRRQAERLIKKHPSLRQELDELGKQLSENPLQGKSIGRGCYKVRLAIESKGKGKSGGARVITHIHVAETTVYLLSIYDKSEQTTLTDKALNQLLKEIQPTA